VEKLNDFVYLCLVKMHIRHHKQNIIFLINMLPQYSDKMTAMLLDLAVVEGGPSPMPRLTQDEMATMVGSVRDVIGRALRALERTGAIRIEGQRILVIDPERLRGMT
jgi:DNA-binding GntR family transcriptional regulator